MLDRPAKSMSRLCGARSIHVACSPLVTAGVRSPGAEKSGIGVSRLTAASLSCSISLDVLLTGTGDAEGVRGDVVGDYGASCGPRPISDRHGRDEDSVAGRADITADRGALLLLPIVVGGDVARSDVRVGADLRVADVRQVRDLGALADRRVLDLDERPRLGGGADVGARAQVAERAHVRPGPDVGVDGGDVRADVRPGLDAGLAPKH